MRTLALICALLSSVSALAETFRCTGTDGRTIYSDAACPPGAETETIDLPDNTLDYSEWRSGHEQTHPAKGRGSARSRRARSKASRATYESSDCQEARQHLSVEESQSVDRSPQRIKAARTRMKLVCQRKEPIDYACRTALKNYEVEAGLPEPNSAASSLEAAKAACR